jgi:hypothetical protein
MPTRTNIIFTLVFSFSMMLITSYMSGSAEVEGRLITAKMFWSMTIGIAVVFGLSSFCHVAGVYKNED